MSLYYFVAPATSREVRLTSFVSRFLVIASVLSAFAYRFGDVLVDSLLPVFKAEFQVLDDTYRIDRLYLDHEGADRVIRVEVGLAHYIVLNGRSYAPDPRGRANASTLAGNVTLPATVTVAIALAWPARRRQALLWRGMLLVPSVALLWAIDVPMILWGSIWSLHVDAFAPGLNSPLLIWNDFLQGGGRLALAVALGLLVANVPAPGLSSPERIEP